MFNIVDYISSVSSSNVATAERFARLSIEKSEQFAQLAWGYSKEAFEDAAKQTKGLSDSKDFNEFFASRSKAAELSASKAAGFARDSYAIATSAQAEVADLVKERVAALHKNAVELVETASKGAPAGSEAAVAAAKSMVAASAVMFDTLTKVGKQAQGYFEAAVKANEATVADNVKAFTGKTSKAK